MHRKSNFSCRLRERERERKKKKRGRNTAEFREQSVQPYRPSFLPSLLPHSLVCSTVLCVCVCFLCPNVQKISTYFPKRDELLLRIVLAFPKPSRIGFACVEWRERERERERESKMQTKKWADRGQHPRTPENPPALQRSVDTRLSQTPCVHACVRANDRWRGVFCSLCAVLCAEGV